MKTSKSKKELARIISENGGWRDGAEWSAQDNLVCFFSGGVPEYKAGDRLWYVNGNDGSLIHSVSAGVKIKNWHQTILSRAEYFHLYPVLDAEVSIAVENNTSLNVTVSDKPTIEQLAQDYRDAKDRAERLQQYADEAKADADAKLKALELTCEAIGLIVSPVTAKQEPWLVITDWRQWRVGDVVSWSLLNHAGEFEIISVHHDQSRNIGDFEVKDKHGGVYRAYGNECRFIRRP